MEYNSDTQKIEDFLKIYPELALKFENNEKDQLIKFFNIKNNIKKRRSSIILDSDQINKLMKKKNTSEFSSSNIENNKMLNKKK